MGKLGSLWDYNFLIYVVDEEDNIIESIAAANHFDVADAAFKAAKATRTAAILQMRNGGRVMKTERTP